MVLVDIDAIANVSRVLRARIEAGLRLPSGSLPPLSILEHPEADVRDEQKEAVAELARLHMQGTGGGSVYRLADAHEGAVDTVLLLARRGFVTGLLDGRAPGTDADTHAWLSLYALDRLPITRVSHGNPRDMHRLRLPMTIEQHPGSAHYMATRGASVIILDQSYNRGVEHPRVLRAYSWAGIARLFTHLPLDVRRERRGF